MTSVASLVTHCTDCNAGTWSSTIGASALSVCIRCSAGTWSSTSAASSSLSCNFCATGSFSSAGASSLSACIWNGCASMDPCTQYYNCATCKAATGCGWCQGQCYSGTASGSTFLSSPSACQSHTGWYFGSMSTCPTDPGLCTTSYNACYNCIQNVNCGWCPTGNTCYYGSATGASSLYSAQISCQNNGGGWSDTVCTTSGIILMAPCVVCNAGYYLRSNGTCASCNAGTWSNSSGATSALTCMNCIAGTWSGSSNATSIAACLPCNAGTWSSMVAATGSNICMNCNAGTLSFISGATSTLQCNAVTTTTSTTTTMPIPLQPRCSVPVQYNLPCPLIVQFAFTGDWNSNISSNVAGFTAQLTEFLGTKMSIPSYRVQALVVCGSQLQSCSAIKSIRCSWS